MKKLLGWLTKKVLFIQDKDDEKKETKSRCSFWRLLAGALTGLIVAGVIFSAGFVARDRVRGRIPRWIDYGEIAYVSRIVDEGRQKRLYVTKSPHSPECLRSHLVIDERLLLCRPGDEVVLTATRGFVPTPRLGSGQNSASAASAKTPKQNLSALPGIIPLDGVPDEEAEEIYSGEPRPLPTKIAAGPVKRPTRR